MPPIVTNSLKDWLKASTSIKLSSDAAVVRIIYEGITPFQSLEDFDKKAIQSLIFIYRERFPAITADIAARITTEVEIPGAKFSSISAQKLIFTADAGKYYSSIGWVMPTMNMHYGNILVSFKIEWEGYIALKSEVAPKETTI